MKPDGWWLAIHERLIKNDPTAPAELAEEALGHIEQHLRFKHPEVRNPDLISDASADAIISYVKAPKTFDPTQGKLFAYLKMSALGDLLNALAKEKRHSRQTKRMFAADVELDDVRGKEDTAERGGAVDSVTESVKLLFDNELDQELAHLIVSGERSTARFAQVLGITQLSFTEQQAAVKRHKDRIKKVLIREGRRQHG